MTAGALLLTAAGAGQAAAAGFEGSDSADVFSWTTELTVETGQTLPRDAICAGCSAHVAGAVSRDLIVMGGDAYVDGSVGRDVFVIGGNLRLGPHAIVARDAVTIGGSLERSAGATIGRQAYSGSWPGGHGARQFLFPIKRAPYLTTIAVVPGLFLLALALAMAGLFPRRLAAGEVSLGAQPAAALGLGCLATMGGFLVALLLGVTVILLPLSGLVLLLMLAGWSFGWAAIFAWAGRRMVAVSEQPEQGMVLTVLVGGLLVTVGLLIPVVNVFLFVAGGTLALGTALASRFGTRA